MSDKAIDLLYSLRLEDGSIWRERAQPFQIDDALAINDDDGPNLHFITRPRGGSKPLALDTPIPTVTGWTTMGEIKVGDEIFDERGVPTKVVYLGEVRYDVPCYNVKLADGTSLVASDDHEWWVIDRKATGNQNKKIRSQQRVYKTLTTQELKDNLYYTPRNDFRWGIPTAGAFELPEQSLPLPPYILGLWLGDGDAKASRITCSDEDFPEYKAIFANLGFPFTEKSLRQKTSLITGTWRFGNPLGTRSNGRGPSQYDAQKILRDLEVLGNKRIPSIYLRGSYKQRLELLRGLLDSDGHQSHSLTYFNSTSSKLADDVAELVISLGWKAWRQSSPARLYDKECGTSYRVGMRATECPFSLLRKVAQWKAPGAQAFRGLNRTIIAIDPVDSVPVRCIGVDAPSHLYLAGKGAIPTHNTSDIAGIMLSWLTMDARPLSNGHIVAANADQASILLDAASSFINNTPYLRNNLHVEAERIVALNGAWIRVLPHSASGAWGLRDAHFIVCDEFCQWEESRRAKKVWTAIRSTVQKVPGCRLIIISSPGEQSHWSWDIYQTAEKSTAWRVSSVEGPVPWHRPQDIQALKDELLPSEFDRLVLGIWSQAEDRAIAPEDYDHAAQTAFPYGKAPAGLLGGGQRFRHPHVAHNYIITVDIGIKNDATVMCVAHKEPMENNPHLSRLVIDHMERWLGSRKSHVQLEDVKKKIMELSGEYHGAKVYADPYQFAGGIQELNKRGVRSEEWPFTTTSVGQVATSLVQVFHNHSIFIPDYDDLKNELLSVRLRENSPGVTRLDHDREKHDDQAVVIGMAAHLLVTNRSTGQSEIWIDAWGKMAPGIKITPTDVGTDLASSLSPFQSWKDFSSYQICLEHRFSNGKCLDCNMSHEFYLYQKGRPNGILES